MNFPLLKTIILSNLIWCAFSPVHAQDKGKEELNFSAGLMATENAFADAIILSLSALINEPEDVRITGAAWSLTYKYYVSEKLAIGGSSVYNPSPDRWIPNFFRDDRWKRRSLTTAGEVTLFWVKQRGFQFYGTVGLGFFAKHKTLYEMQTETDFGYTFQASPVGLRMGDKVGVFVELGYGYKGVFNGGLSMRF
ncbi:hypothetical protein LZD49_14910 [Dyadobacter sp. CY261]|uniref:hypothetical protein n=1 Tax=Dyadobacter sp. CY261 TaxID=2907203 RepID=UPI001F26F8E6|nr:hypothetical protein [Dyadobacter sp. CY261]MCF0071766.1 hypothetical protein [Dyadobacter sp. CY261]